MNRNYAANRELFLRTAPDSEAQSLRVAGRAGASTHGGEVGFDLAAEIYSNGLLLDVDPATDTVVDLGGGVAGPSIAYKLLHRRSTVISIEAEAGRHREANEWVKRARLESVIGIQLIHLSFLDSRLIPIWSKDGLRIFFNNYNGRMIDDRNTQQAVEMLLSERCCAGTVVVALDPLFSAYGGEWSYEVFQTAYCRGDFLWHSGNKVFHKFHKYTKKCNGLSDSVVRHHMKRPTAVVFDRMFYPA